VPAAALPGPIGSELMRLSTILREEVVQLREMMQQLKNYDIAPEQLVNTIADLAHRFQCETGITARFITSLERLDLSPRACAEVARVVQEALVNVRKHSGAHNVHIRLTAAEGRCLLLIDDDGRGFPFAGRLSQAALDQTHQGPWVIKDRVRLLGGEVTVESDPGRGTRLEITVPLGSYALQA
jgi:signal transduction histidine kinase